MWHVGSGHNVWAGFGVLHLVVSEPRLQQLGCGMGLQKQSLKKISQFLNFESSEGGIPNLRPKPVSIILNFSKYFPGLSICTETLLGYSR